MGSTTTDVATIVDPVTGEAIKLGEYTTDSLALIADRAGGILAELAAFRQRLNDELAARLDAMGTRTADVGEWRLEANAPTSEEYRLDVLRTGLTEAAKAGARLEEGILDRVIVTPEPKPPEPRIDKRVVNNLKRSDDRRVLAAIAEARTVVNNRRTVKISRREEPSA